MKAMVRQMPVNDVALVIWTMLWEAEHGRRPKVSELTDLGRVALGKKVFEWLDYRDDCRPHWSDEIVYCATLIDHGVERDHPDGIDVALRTPEAFMDIGRTRS